MFQFIYAIVNKRPHVGILPADEPNSKEKVDAWCIQMREAGAEVRVMYTRPLELDEKQCALLVAFQITEGAADIGLLEPLLTQAVGSGFP